MKDFIRQFIVIMSFLPLAFFFILAATEGWKFLLKAMAMFVIYLVALFSVANLVMKFASWLEVP